MKTKTFALAFLLLLALSSVGLAQHNPTPAELSQRYIPVTIAAGSSLSVAISVSACTVAGIQMPVAADGWTAANLTFQASADGVVFGEFKDEGGVVKTVTVGTDDYILLSPGDWWSIRWLKIRSGPAAAPVNQAAARVVKLICR